MAGLDRVSHRAAGTIIAGVAAATFAALALLTGSESREPGAAAPQAATVALPTTPATTTPTVTQTTPPKPTPDAEQARVIQGNRGRDSAASAVETAPGSEPLAREVGQMMITGYSGAYPSDQVLGRIRRGQVGGVIIMGENVGPRLASAVAAMQAAAEQAGRRLLIGVDQEGGDVKRLAGPPSASAAAMGSSAAARRQGRATGQMLRRYGITADFAPVADVGHAGTFLGSRAFAPTAAETAREACAFARGLQSAGVHATLKHFPGLGYAAENTDVAAATISQSTAALERDLLAYRRCPTPLVMVSNAVYTSLDPGTPAVFSRRIIGGLLRGKLGYQGVVISDSLTATSVASPTTAVRAAQAGVDLLLYIPPDVSALAYQKVLAAARNGQISRSRISDAARRVRELTGS